MSEPESSAADISTSGGGGVSGDLHPIFKTDPAELMQYIGKEICVVSEDGTSHTGRCYTIDPVSQSVVLAKFDNDRESLAQLQIVMGHCVEKILVLDEDASKYESQLDSLFKNQMLVDLPQEAIKEKREMLKSWLLKNRIPIEVSGEESEILSISDALFIEPPYGAENCRSTNEIILGRVQGLIKNMPNDIKDWD